MGSGKLTPELRDKCIELARLGLTVKIICDAVKITPETWQNWRVRARSGEEPYASFVEDVNEARAQKAIEMSEVLDKQIKKKGDPKYAMKYLAVFHRVQEEPVKKQVEITNNHTLALQPTFDVSKLNDEEFEMWCRLLEKVRPGGEKVPEPEIMEPKLIDIKPSE